MKFINPFTLVLATLLTEQVYSHVTATPREGPEASYFVAFFRVPHGCSTSPTVEVHIEWDEELLKDETLSFSPQYINGWKTKNIGDTTKPADNSTGLSDSHGSQAGGGISKTKGVIYSGQEIPSDQFADFGISFKLPTIKSLPKERNATLFFPVRQLCKDGNWANWTAIGDSKFPPPSIKLIALDAKSANSTGSTQKADAKSLVAAGSTFFLATAIALLSL